MEKEIEIEFSHGGMLVEAPKKLTDRLKKEGFVFYVDMEGKEVTKKEFDRLRNQYLKSKSGGIK